MDLFAALRAFTMVVDRGAFARAADVMGLSTSSVTRQVDALQDHLGVLLLNRSTRRLTLTDAGERYFEQVQRILGELDDANRSIGDRAGPPRGILRVSLPVAFGQMHVAPMLPAFLAAHPGIELELDLTDAQINLVEDRVDVAIRLGLVEAPGLIVRKLAPMRRIICASPEYLARRGVPTLPGDLTNHDCCLFAYGRGDQSWRLKKGSVEQVVRVAGPLRANNSIVLRDAAVADLGLVLLPTWLLGEDIKGGRLRPLLTDWEASPTGPEAAIHAVFLPNRRSSTKVRAFIDFLILHFGSPPYWDRK